MKHDMNQLPSAQESTKAAPSLEHIELRRIISALDQFGVPHTAPEDESIQLFTHERINMMLNRARNMEESLHITGNTLRVMQDSLKLPESTLAEFRREATILTMREAYGMSEEQIAEEMERYDEIASQNAGAEAEAGTEQNDAPALSIQPDDK